MYTLVKMHTYTPKNRLEKDILMLLEKEDRRTFKDLKAMKNHKTAMSLEIESLSEKHPRCKKIYFSGWNRCENKKDEPLDVYGLINMTYYYGKPL